MPFEHPYIRIGDLAPEKMDEAQGWAVSEFRVVLSEKENCSSTMFHAVFQAGDRLKKHRHDSCDEQYYVVSGHGLAGAGADRARALE